MPDVHDSATVHTWVRSLRDLRRGDVDLAGGKAANLGELLTAGLPVPNGFVVTTDGYRHFVDSAGIREELLAEAAGSDSVADAERASARIAALFAAHEIPAELTAEILAAYEDLATADPQDATLPPGHLAVAVRSSATAEDLEGASFAGQQDTFLNISGAGALLDAIRSCWQSLWTARAIGYRARQGIAPATVSLAVVVQTLVDADASGVMFTANPANGRRDELLISAAWGLGEPVGGGTVTPDEIVLRRSGEGLTVSRTKVGEKEVRTVRTAAGTVENEVPAALRSRAVLTDPEALRLGELGTRIADHYGRPMDVEWARRGDRFAIVQARPVTALPDPVGEVPTEWPLPEDTSFYFRASIVEQLPDPLTPLFGDVVESGVKTSLDLLMTSVMDRAYLPNEVGFPQINGYAYYRYGRRALLRLSVAAVPLLGQLLRGAERNWREKYLPDYRQAVQDVQAWEIAQQDTAALLDGVVELTKQACVYYTGVQQIIPLAAGGESLFTALYQRTMRRPGDPPASTFVLGGLSKPIRAELSLFELAAWCREHPELTGVLERPGQGREAALRLAYGEAPEGVSPQTWTQWRHRIGAHLDEYGHAVYNLDFANPVAADDPSPVLQALRHYLGGDLPDPAARQQRLAGERDRATGELLARLDPVRGAIARPLLAFTQRVAPLREDALAEVGLAWPLIRRLLSELGARLTDVGLLADPDDVYWLHEDEIRSAVDAFGRKETFTPMTAQIEQRREQWRGRRLAEPPDILPQRQSSIWRRWMPTATADETGRALRGLGASGGQAEAAACLVLDAADFAKMQPGMVLVARITTPAYTPLFALASAVVTDIGGPLSHSSIVAREYGIPAVLGTGVATRRIVDGDRLFVDGSAGVVRLPGDHQDDSAPPAAEARRGRGLAAAAGVTALGVAVAVLRRGRR